MVERESTLTMIPPSNLNARVVVPLANLTVWLRSLLPQAEAKLFRQKCAGWVQERKFSKIIRAKENENFSKE